MAIDTQVLHDMIAAFDEIPELRASRLHIDVKSRLVTIRGRVANDALRKTVERAARSIVGPRALVLNLSVAPGARVVPDSYRDAARQGDNGFVNEPSHLLNGT